MTVLGMGINVYGAIRHIWTQSQHFKITRFSFLFPFAWHGVRLASMHWSAGIKGAEILNL
jgi:hypothetical protein